MKEFHRISETVSKGETLASQVQERSSMLPLSNPQVQVFLALHAFSGETDAMNKWLEEDETGTSLSSKFRAYIEDSARTPDELEINVREPEALTTLLQKIRVHPPEPTIH